MSYIIQTKHCSCCKEIKKFSEFHRNRAEKSGYQRQCKKCKSKADKRYSQEHFAKVYEKNKKYYNSLQGYLRHVYRNMFRRCNNPKHKQFKDWGGRGIKINFVCFDDFFDYVTKELKVDPFGLTIDRKDNDGHYEIGNIRFITRSENSKNRRRNIKK